MRNWDWDNNRIMLKNRYLKIMINKFNNWIKSIRCINREKTWECKKQKEFNHKINLNNNKTCNNFWFNKWMIKRLRNNKIK